MKWGRTGEAVIAFNLGHWLKNILLLYFSSLNYCPDLFAPLSSPVTLLFCSSYSSWYYTKQGPWFLKAASLTKSVGLCRRAFSCPLLLDLPEGTDTFHGHTFLSMLASSFTSVLLNATTSGFMDWHLFFMAQQFWLATGLSVSKAVICSKSLFCLKEF